ncbi:MAG: nucleoside-triphosphatase, partial [Melioribacteraceae bacterium]|nr:nucleoside-triphosphatase [Melioribacteraceae bacterium]
SGKTTKLFTYIKKLPSVDGILVPIVNEKRMLYHISSKVMKVFEVDKESSKTVSIGKYIFLKESFDWANQKILQSYNDEPDYLVIDEIGKLELRKEGLHDSFATILKSISHSNTSLILVIRNYLLNEVMRTYNIPEENYEILEL